MNQPTSEPSEGIDTSPTVFRPCILHTHNQHAADYIMVKSTMSPPLGKDQSAPLIMEVQSLLTSYAFHISSSILFWDPPSYHHLFIPYHFCFQSVPAEDLISKTYLQLGRIPSCRCNAKLELALLGCPTAKVLMCW